MNIQYLSDYAGKQIAVVIPIEQWNEIVRAHPDVQSMEAKTPDKEPPAKNYTMGDFIGTISAETADALLHHVNESRDEWDRNS
jgi:hypothetical protein